jgi:hypothetical protein
MWAYFFYSKLKSTAYEEDYFISSFTCNWSNCIFAGDFSNATIVQNEKAKIEKATLVIKQGKIVAVGATVDIPKEAIVVDCNGKFIYPSFVDPLTDYGANTPKRGAAGFNFGAPGQFLSNKPGAYNWNQAIKPEVNAVESFSID